METATQSQPTRLISEADFGHVRFLTSGCCEDTGNVGAEELKAQGMDYQEYPNGDFYPLTDLESCFIAEEYVALGSNPEFDCLLGYSAVYQGHKYLVPTIEIGFDDSENSTLIPQADAKTLNDEARALAQHICDVTGGFFRWSEQPAEEHDDGFGRFVVEILVPIDYVQNVAIGMDSWQHHLKGIANSLQS